MNTMISYWLKYYRHECGLTQQQVADRLKIERSTYTYYETGKTKPDIETIVKIAKVFNVNYTDILKGIDAEFEDAVSDIHSVVMDENIPEGKKNKKYRTHATTKYEVELLFVLRNLNPKQRKEVLKFAKSFVSDEAEDETNDEYYDDLEQSYEKEEDTTTEE